MTGGKHTPKLELVRWVVFDSVFDDQINLVDGTGEECVAFVNADNPVTQLMLSAPKMYEALKLAEEWLDGWASAEPYLADIRAALASARGEKQ